MSSFQDLQRARESVKRQPTSNLAVVVDVDPERGVKIRRYGKKEATNIYYNSLQIVAPGDVVLLKETSGTIVIEGKLQYPIGGANIG